MFRVEGFRVPYWGTEEGNILGIYANGLYGEYIPLFPNNHH